MNERELAILNVVSKEFGAALSSLRESFEKQLEDQRNEFEQKYSSLEQALNNIKGAPGIDVASLASEAAALIQLPEPLQLPDIGAMVSAAVAELPPAEPGKSVTAEDVKPLLEQMVKATVAEIPVPEAPQLPDIVGMVSAAVAEIPVPEPASGEDGRDALQLEVLPCIDEGKSYPRGSYATHLGGLWRAFEKTHGLRGWECLVDGIASLEVTNTDERNFTVTVTRASGQEETKSFALPVMIYRGVFKSGAEYLPGDTVTWGGSLWHCDELSTDKPGEIGSKGWTLATKRGRDGRDKT
ncbi:phage gp6-like head-tail connector protein [Cedecea neteri]|uniref:phage gp6-like head-tail connector protein n=1 Tax=Cedecea neteri TaxID=158822 RepID=UPI002AA7096A|nr:phage gp6-like head-tail connector protein [Cedecea neteri]WPU24509.1 phage gp6-like head-tail connector protein [Cedecea neteri]